MRVIGSLDEVAGEYDAVLCDVWGVVHDGQDVYPGAARALRRARAAGLAVVLVTNMPRPSTTMPQALARMDFPDDAWDAIVTSGDVIRAELALRAPGPVHRLGRRTDRGLWDDLGLTFVEDLSEAGFVAIAGLRGRADSPGAYAAELQQARARDLELLCANPDLQVRTGGVLTWCAGSVAHEYAAMGGRVVQGGKPHPPIYQRAREVLDGLVGRPVPRERILAIGDGIGTDLLGANRQGLDALFIAGGMHGDALLDASGGVDRARVDAALATGGVTATYVVPALV